MTEKCNQCGNEYKSIATHWQMSSSCQHPTFTQRQREIIVGLLMGDGSIHRDNRGNPRLEIQMVSKNYLEHVAKKFGTLGTQVSLYRTAEESAKRNRERGFSTTVNEENYSDAYRWRTMSHPELQEFADWYSTGEKVWPDDIDLTPTTLKHWYCGDGSWHSSGSNNCIQISMFNERKEKDKIDKIFKNSNLPTPSNYNITETSCNVRFTVKDSEKLWEYMGDPLPDFDYKWPEVYR